MNKNKGFTLIELLVVIAIIGILSSVVLASLNNARTKAKIAAVQSTLSSMRAQAELGINTNGKYIPNLCLSTSAQGGLNTLIASLNNPASKITGIVCAVDAADSSALTMKWAVEVSIDGKYYCADSTGYSGMSLKDGSAKALSGSTAKITVPTGANSPVITPHYGATDLICASN